MLAGTAALVVAACGDSTAPPDSYVTLTIRVTQIDGPSVFDPGNGLPRIECDITLSASAEGNTSAEWRDATLYFFAGLDRRTPIDSTVLVMQDVRDSWQSGGIAPGQSQVSGWRISAGIPFSASLVYRYQVKDGAVQSTSVAFNCGPAIPFPSVPPTTSAVTVQPDSNEIEAGSVLTVHFVAQSDVGLWASAVRVSGACALEQRFIERLQQSSEHTAQFTIAGGCAGRPLSIDIGATDAALQVTTAHVPRSFAVVDHTPPHIWADHLPNATDYVFAGDTLQPYVVAWDNDGIQSIIWEIGGVRDSTSGGGGWMAIPIPPQLTGTSIQLRFWARDAAGLVSDTIVAPASGLWIYPTVRPSMTSTTINGDIQDLVFDQKRGVLYLRQNQNLARIGVFSLATMSITETIPAGVWDLDLTPGGDSLILALPYDRALGIIDLQQSPRVLTRLPIQSLITGQAPWQVRVGANGKAYVQIMGPPPAPSGLLEIDLTTRAERLVPGSDNLLDARYERSFDRTALIFQHGTDLLERYDVLTGQFGVPHHPNSVYGPLRVDDSGARVSVGLDVYDANLDFLRRVAAVYGAEAMPGGVLSKDGAYMYQVLGFRGVARTRTSDGAVIDRFVVPFSASGYLRVSPDGNTLVVMDSFIGTARIALVDLR
jgi:hypothetical protein